MKNQAASVDVWEVRGETCRKIVQGKWEVSGGRKGSAREVWVRAGKSAGEFV